MSEPKRILFLMTDQQRWDTIHALGCENAITPNLDRLAAEAAVFENCYTPAPVCAPARLSLYSGLYPAGHGSCNNSPDIVYTGDGLYGMLTAGGFDTCAVGKMHYIRDRYALHGFQRRITQEELPDPVNDDYTRFLMNTEYRDVIDYNGQRSEMYYIPQLSQLPQRVHPTQWIGDRTVDVLKELDPAKPAFIFSSFIHPHPPFAPPVPWNKLHRREMDPPFVPENSRDLMTYHNYHQNTYKGLSAGADYHLLTQMKNFYYSCISFVDYQIGRILDVLREREMYDDTLIIFTSDHGEMLGDYLCLGKRTMLDASAKVPLLVKYPGRAPERRREVCSLVDLMPTILNYAGLPLPERLDGQDLFTEDYRREVVYSQFSNGTTGLYMAASNHDKLVYSAADRRFWYFDQYPEREDRYDSQSSRCRELRRLLENYIASDQSLEQDDRVIDMDQYRRDYRYRLVKQDSVNRKEDERALLPPGYDIDVDIVYTWKRKKEQ